MGAPRQKRLASQTGARLVIAHDGPRQVVAWLAVEQETDDRPTGMDLDQPLLRPVLTADIEISEPTGVRDVFHGAAIDMLLRVHGGPSTKTPGGGLRSRCLQPDVVRAALSYANDCSIYVGQGIGARNFPTLAQREMLITAHHSSLKVHHRCFLAYGSDALSGAAPDGPPTPPDRTHRGPLHLRDPRIGAMWA